MYRRRQVTNPGSTAVSTARPRYSPPVSTGGEPVEDFNIHGAMLSDSRNAYVESVWNGELGNKYYIRCQPHVDLRSTVLIINDFVRCSSYEGSKTLFDHFEGLDGELLFRHQRGVSILVLLGERSLRLNRGYGLRRSDFVLTNVIPADIADGTQVWLCIWRLPSSELTKLSSGA